MMPTGSESDSASPPPSEDESMGAETGSEAGSDDGAAAGAADAGADGSRARPWLVPHHVVPPPPRPGERHVRLPRLGILLSDDELRGAVDGWFHKPMIVLALLILPLLALEFILLGKQPQLREGILGILIPTGLAVIWLAFFIEFVVKVTVAESRVEYVRRHWIDVAIIVLPLLRPLRIARVARTARIFTLRGVGLKMARYGFALFLGVEAGDRLAKRIGLRRTGRRDPSSMTRHQLVHELRRLRRQVDAWEAWFDEHRSHRERFGTDAHFEGRPPPEDDVAAETGPGTDDEPRADRSQAP